MCVEIHIKWSKINREFSFNLLGIGHPSSAFFLSFVLELESKEGMHLPAMMLFSSKAFYLLFFSTITIMMTREDRISVV